MRSSFSHCGSSRRRQIGAGALLFTVCLAATTRTAPVDAAGAPPTLATPLQVANALDKIIQPRFQVDAGLFGEDRIISELDGHPRIDEIDAETKSERRRFRALRSAGRSYVIGMLHIAHKPGSHIHTHDHGPMDRDFVPSADSLVSVNSSEKRATKSYDWATTHLTNVVTPYLATVKRGQPANIDYGGWLVALRPVRAEHDTCISCHVGAHRGDTLGVMTYAVNKTKSDRPVTAAWSGGG